MRNPAPRIVMVLGLILFLALLSQRLITEGLANGAQAALLNTQSCPPNQFPCSSQPPGYFPLGWQADQAPLRALSNTLAIASPIYSDDSKLQTRRADIAFALGEHQDAALLAPPLALTCAQDAVLTDQRRQPVAIGRAYENSLLQAYQQLDRQNWQGAVDCFNTAAVMGASFMSQSDKVGFFTALGENSAAQQASNPSPALTATLAGTYFQRAGLADRAVTQLLQAQSLPDWNTLSAAQQSRNWFYLGASLAAQGNNDNAAQDYQKALSQDQTSREPRLALAALAQAQNRRAGIQDAVDWLVANGPTYPLSATTTLANNAPPQAGYQLAGYDVAEESIAASPFVDAWLWWRKATTSAPACANCVEAGDYLIQKTPLVNLLANAGFEWPNSSRDGAPEGLIFSSKGYPGVVSNPVAADAPAATHVLAVQPGNIGIRLDSFPLSVDGSGHYLIGFWAQYRQADWSVGLACPDQAGRPLMISMQNHTNKQATGDWRHFAQLLSLNTDQQIGLCAVELVANYAPTQWDQILIAKAPSGPQP